MPFDFITHLSPLLKWLTGPAAGALLAGGWKAFVTVQAWRAKRKTLQAFQGHGEIVDQLLYLLNETPADYVQIMQVHNGGGPLKAGLSMSMTCLFEVHRATCRPLKKILTGLEIDEHYRLMINKLLEVKDGAAAVEDVDDPFLQDVYHQMGAKYTRVVLLGIKRKGIFFVRCTSSSAPLDEPDHQLIFRQAISTLRKFY